MAVLSFRSIFSRSICLLMFVYGSELTSNMSTNVRTTENQTVYSSTSTLINFSESSSSRLGSSTQGDYTSSPPMTSTYWTSSTQQPTPTTHLQDPDDSSIYSTDLSSSTYALTSTKETSVSPTFATSSHTFISSRSSTANISTSATFATSNSTVNTTEGSLPIHVTTFLAATLVLGLVVIFVVTMIIMFMVRSRKQTLPLRALSRSSYGSRSEREGAVSPLSYSSGMDFNNKASPNGTSEAASEKRWSTFRSASPEENRQEQHDYSKPGDTDEAATQDRPINELSMDKNGHSFKGDPSCRHDVDIGDRLILSIEGKSDTCTEESLSKCGGGDSNILPHFKETVLQKGHPNLKRNSSGSIPKTSPNLLLGNNTGRFLFETSTEEPEKGTADAFCEDGDSRLLLPIIIETDEEKTSGAKGERKDACRISLFKETAV